MLSARDETVLNSTQEFILRKKIKILITVGVILINVGCYVIYKSFTKA